MDSCSVKVHLHYSAISFGTENANRQGTKLTSLLQSQDLWLKGYQLLKKSKNPLQVLLKFFDVRNTYNWIGYSAVGEVVEVGSRVHQDLRVGDIVHVGGERAPHAEVVVCPQNFVFKLEPQLYSQHPYFYALPTLVSVPLHAIMHAKDALLAPGPHRALVLGGGVIGTFAGMIAEKEGIDVVFEDAISHCLASSFLNRYKSEHRDFDLVFACTTSSDGLSDRLSLCRDGAVLSLVGEIPLQLDRGLLESKYMTVRFCKSFGYGRGDKAYEYGVATIDASFPHSLRSNIEKAIRFISNAKETLFSKRSCFQILSPEEVEMNENSKKINLIQWKNPPF